MRETIFVWDSVNDCVMSELDGSGALQVTYTNEPQQYGGVISQRRGTTTSTYHADALGSTRALTDNSGNVTDTYLNDAWGNSVASAGTTVNPFKWVGKYGYYTDNSTGQIYVRARMYQPTVARWLSVDPIGVINGDNLYLYVQRFIDPSGSQCQAPDGVTYRPRGYFRESLIEPRGIGVGWPEKLFDWGGSNFDTAWSPWESVFREERLFIQDGCCCCDEVAFVQIIRNWYKTENTLLEILRWDDWHLDSQSGSYLDPFQRYGIPCYDPKQSKPHQARMQDLPGFRLTYTPFGRYSYFRQEFETCVVCTSGVEGPKIKNDALAGITVYGCMRWEHEFSRDKLGNLHSGVMMGKKVPYRVVGRWFDTGLGKKSAIAAEDWSASEWVGGKGFPPTKDFERLITSFVFPSQSPPFP